MKTGFILDCSVTMSWCFEDESSPYADEVLLSLKQTRALVPSLWTLEVANVLLMAKRKNRLTESKMVRFTHLLSQLPISIDENPLDMKHILFLADTHQLTSYDTCYLNLALTHGLPIATLDEKMREASQRAGIELYNPSE